MHAAIPDSSAQWRSRSSEDIAWIQFDDGFVAYHRPSGKTHFFNAASHDLICRILKVPTDLSNIAEEFVPENNAEYPVEFLEEMTSLLDRLEALGIVERV